MTAYKTFLSSSNSLYFVSTYFISVSKSGGYRHVQARVYTFALLYPDQQYPHQQYLSDKLERIQRNASRWIIGKDVDYDERLSWLGWMDLKTRREYLSLVQLFKYIKGYSNIKLNNYVSFANGRTRSSNTCKIWKPYARTNILKYSFWNRYIAR